MTNIDIANLLRNQAADMVRTGDNLYRIRAFRQAAFSVLALPQEVETLVASDGPKSLERVRGIGKSLAGTIADLVRTGPPERAGGFIRETPPTTAA